MVVVRVVFTALICMFLFWRISDEYKQVNMRILNLMLSALTFKDVLTSEELPEQVNRQLMHKNERYFDFVTNVIPKQSDAYAMKGFCQAQLNKIDDALFSYQRSIAIGPPVVWAYYNVGLLYLMKNDFMHARDSFQMALQVPVEMNFLFLRQSKIYRDIIRQDPGFNAVNRVKVTYALSQYWLEVTAKILNEHIVALPKEAQIHLRVL